MALGHFKVKKNISGTPLTKWNPLIPRSTILVVKINDNVYFLSRCWIAVTSLSPLSNYGLKNKFFY